MKPNQEFIRLLNNKVTGDPSANYTLSWETDPYPYIPTTLTYSRTSNDYWIARRTSSSSTSHLIQSTQSYDYFGLAGTPNNSLANMIGCNWGITGGSGVYSVEIPVGPILDGSSRAVGNKVLEGDINFYFAWDIAGSTQSYINISTYHYPSMGSYRSTITWYIDGISQKVISTSVAGLKIVWNKNTSVSSLYLSSGGGSYISDSSTYTFWDSYTVSNTNMPFCFYGNILSSTQSIEAFIPQFIVSNHQKRGLTGSSYTQTSNPPPLSQMFDPNVKYGSY